ncbi:MAG TPA: PilZ domain-containing protein [Phycisphaerales bacterium]|nr:PilZ domain-containing protein [Phycisphaerales bacterium]
MTFHISIPPPLSTPGSNRRRHGRIRCEGVTCSIGKVLEISASGARIRAAMGKAREGDETTIEILGLEGPIRLGVRVMWVVDDGVADGERCSMAGLAYTALGDAQRRALADLARASASNPTLHHDAA